MSYDHIHATPRNLKTRAEQSRTRTFEGAAIRVEAHRDDPERLGLILPDTDEPIAPTHWSFGQLSSLVGAPAAYLRQLPAPLTGINLQYGLANHRAEQIKTMEVANGRTELRAVTGPDYGHIYDHELVSAVQRIAGNGTGDTRWKVPGVLDWSTGIFNPRVDVSVRRQCALLTLTRSNLCYVPMARLLRTCGSWKLSKCYSRCEDQDQHGRKRRMA